MSRSCLSSRLRFIVLLLFLCVCVHYVFTMRRVPPVFFEQRLRSSRRSRSDLLGPAPRTILLSCRPFTCTRLWLCSPPCRRMCFSNRASWFCRLRVCCGFSPLRNCVRRMFKRRIASGADKRTTLSLNLIVLSLDVVVIACVACLRQHLISMPSWSDMSPHLGAGASKPESECFSFSLVNSASRGSFTPVTPWLLRE